MHNKYSINIIFEINKVYGDFKCLYMTRHLVFSKIKKNISDNKEKFHKKESFNRKYILNDQEICTFIFLTCFEKSMILLMLIF